MFALVFLMLPGIVAMPKQLGRHCGPACQMNCSMAHCSSCCGRIDTAQPALRKRYLVATARRQLSNAPITFARRGAQFHSIFRGKERPHASQKRAQYNEAPARSRLLSHNKMHQIRRAPVALRKNRTYHKQMYTSHLFERGWSSSDSSFRLPETRAERLPRARCEFSAKSADKLLTYAKRVAASAKAQLADQGFRYGKTCLFTGLADENDGQSITAHRTFMSSLLRHHPNLMTPMIVLECGYNGTPLSKMMPRTRAMLREQYPPTLFIKPFVCPEVPVQWPLQSFHDGSTAVMTSSKEDTASFYRWLQLFTLSSCGSIVSIDTSDMLVLKPIPHLLIPFRVLNGTDFAAAERCDSRLEGQGSAHYFNAGLYLVGKRHLNAETYASLISVAMSPRQPSAFEPKRWAADQDVLNAYFDPLRGGQDRTVLGYLDNYATEYADPEDPKYRRCKSQNAARILHFQSTKPWATSSSAPGEMILQPHILSAEKLWRAAHYRDKTIIVGGGPSVRAPVGEYIDMFARVVRINDYKIGSASTTGLKTTDVIIHKATKKGRFSTFSREHILLADFGENATTLETRMMQPEGSGLRLEQVTRLPAHYYNKLKQEMALAAGVPYYDAVLQLNEPYHPLSGTIALAWALRTTTERPVYFIGFDMMLGAEYSHGSQQSASAVSKRSLSKWHRVDYDRALLHKLEFVDKSARRLNAPVAAA